MEVYPSHFSPTQFFLLFFPLSLWTGIIETSNALKNLSQSFPSIYDQILLLCFSLLLYMKDLYTDWKKLFCLSLIVYEPSEEILGLQGKVMHNMGKERRIWISKSILLLTAPSMSIFKCATSGYFGWKLKGRRKLKKPLFSVFS